MLIEKFSLFLHTFC